jgi:hypothetical protein
VLIHADVLRFAVRYLLIIYEASVACTIGRG